MIRLTPRRAAYALTLGALMLTSPTAHAQQPVKQRVEGAWQGTLTLGAASLRLGLSIARNAQGALGAELTSIDQGNAKLPARFSMQGDTLVVDVDAATIHYTATVTPAGDSLRGQFRQGGTTRPLDMPRVSALTVVTPPARPQMPKPPFPYRTESVSIPSVHGVTLAGTLAIPTGAGPFPTVIFVTGSGPQDRDETLLGHKPFLVIADHLARHGIASLRYDDRGTAQSTGNFAAGTSADFADDAEAAVRFARGRAEVMADKVGIIGHSEGGLIGPIVATRSHDVAFVVMMAGPGIRGDSILALQQRLIMEANGVPHDQAALGAANNAKLFAAIAGARDSADAELRARRVVREGTATVPEEQRVAMTQRFEASLPQLLTPWMRWFLAFDPQPTLRRLTVPTLAINGTLDLQVPARENLPAIAAALAAAGNRDYRTVALTGLNHLFQTATTGNPAEYEKIEETVAPAALELITEWIRERAAKR